MQLSRLGIRLLGTYAYASKIENVGKQKKARSIARVALAEQSLACSVRA